MKNILLSFTIFGSLFLIVPIGFSAEDPPKLSKSDLKKRLTTIQYEVTQEDGTEPPFKNEYWDNKKDGIYVNIVSGEPLFSSTHKYKSGTGWPSFTQPIEKKNITEHKDRKLFQVRTEIRSKSSRSHLGHVFNDGPAPTGKRYCMNSAALRFVPKENMKKEGYGKYLSLFTDASKKNSKQGDISSKLKIATFAGGCFWCIEADFEKIAGVKKAISGFSGGHVKNPSYEAVSAGTTGHTEVVQIYFNPDIISYDQLLKKFWRSIDPTTSNKQFVDEGPQYRSAIFYHDEEQRKKAEASKVRLKTSRKLKNKPIVTEIQKFDTFYEAPAKHQDYYKKNPIRYKYYRYRSGRDQFLEKTWGPKK